MAQAAAKRAASRAHEGEKRRGLRSLSPQYGSQDPPSIHPRGPQEDPKSPKDAPKRRQRCPQEASNRPPKRHPKRSREASRCFLITPQTRSERLRSVKQRIVIH